MKTLLKMYFSDLEMRICRDEDRSNEDIALSEVELYAAHMVKLPIISHTKILCSFGKSEVGKF